MKFFKQAKASTWLCVAAATAAPALSLRAQTTSFTLETATIEDLQRAMNAGALSSVELMSLYLNRRNVYDQGGMKLNSVVEINTNAMADAIAADQRRANGTTRGLLDGLPFLVKDSYNSIGNATSGGIKAWLNMRPDNDNFIVGALKNSGAVLYGHANMDTFATSATSTVSDSYGTTLNAYTLGTPAGSSGGPAVATGAGMAAFAFGGETGGSIRNPSDRAGVVGFKVGVGTISVAGILALVPDRDVIGPMARYVRDSAAIMDIASQQDPNDVWATVDYTPGRARPSGFVAKNDLGTLQGKRIGVISTYVGNPYIGTPSTPNSANTTGVTAISAEIKTIFDRARTELQSLGATVTEVSLPSGVDTAVTLGTGQPTRALTTATNSSKAVANAHIEFIRSVIKNPTPDRPAEDPVFRMTQARQVTSSVSAATLTNIQNNSVLTFTSPEATEHFQAQAIYNQRFESFMAANGFDALIWPVHTVKSRTSATVPGRDLINNIGLPLCTVPMGVIPSTGEPSDMGIAGRYRGEADILALARAYETATNYRVPSPLAPPLAGESFNYTAAPRTAFKRKSAAIEPNVLRVVAPSERAEKLPPVLSIAKKAEVSVTASGSKRLVLRGIAADQSGVGTLRVYVNGHEVASKVNNGWKAVVPMSSVEQWTESNAVNVLVLAKDAYGNTSATQKVVALPTAVSLQ